MWNLNVGRFRNLHEMYEKRREVELSVRADNERFLTDVGNRDQGAGALRATGRAGYLQYGPRIPVKKGYYRARWIGTVDSAPGGQVGYVEVWGGPERRLDRQPVAAAGPDAHRRLAHIDFNLPDDLEALEYRFYVNQGVRMTLERVELYSATAVPTDN